MEISFLQGRAETQDHWHWRPGWRLGRRMYTMHLTLQAAPEAGAAIGRLQQSIAAIDVLRPVPIEGLHLTMTGVGFTDEVTDGQLEEVAQQVFTKARTMSASPLILDSLFVGSEAIMLGAQPVDWLDEILLHQRRAVDAVLGPRQWGEFHPHVSIAYADGATSVRAAVERLAEDAAPLPPLVVDPPTLTLMRLGRDRRVYEWDVVRECPLGL